MTSLQAPYLPSTQLSQVCRSNANEAQPYSQRPQVIDNKQNVCRSNANEAQPYSQGPQVIDNKQNGLYFEEMSPNSLDTLSSADLWDDSSGFTANKQNDGNLVELFKAGFSNMVQQLSESHTHVAHLECEIKNLKEEKLKQEYQNHTCVMRLKDQIRDLEQKAELDLEELKIRQNQIEADVPSLEEQIKSLKDVMHDLNISENLYSELIAIPKESRTIREHILVLAYEKTLKFHHDLQTTRQERDTSREALSRANDEVQKLRRDMQRNAAIDAVEQQGKIKEIEVLVARNERLETELQSSNLQLQVLSAKGALYDEVRCKLVQLEEVMLAKEKEKNDLSMASQNLLKEKSESEELLKNKLHCIELLQMEKGYLNGHYKAQEDQLRKLEAEKISLQEKIHELEQAQQGFYSRVLSNEDTAQAIRQHLLHEEKLQLQQNNKQELDLLRTQIAEAADFEIQMLRKTRDLAVSEREKAQMALHESRTENEKLIERYNELKFASLRSSNSEDDGISKTESKLQKIQEETYHELCHTKIENEVLSKKLESSTQNLLKVESDLTKAIVDLKLDLEVANAGLRQYKAEEQLLNEALLNACKVYADLSVECTMGEKGVIYPIQKKNYIISTIVDRYKSLRDSLELLESEREMLKVKVAETEEKVYSMNQKIAFMDEPVSSLANTIQQRDKTLKEALQMKEVLERKLREALMDKSKATRSLQCLREDLKRVLKARGNMESLQKILIEKDANLGNAVSEKLARLKHSP